MINRELAWTLLPLTGFLSQMGGTYNKLFRRLGVPLVITAFSLVFGGFSPWWPVLFFSVFLTTTLPFTLEGDDIHAHWFNWVWIWIAGFILGLPCILIGGSLWLCLVPSIVQGICGTLSNVKATAKYFQWKFCEFIIWAAMAYCYALPLYLR